MTKKTAEVAANTETTEVKAPSTRSQAFAMLDGELAGMARKDATAALIEKLGIGTAYAGTIFQDHREKAKKNGKLVPTYRVQGNGSELKLATSHVVSAPEGAYLTPEDAVNAYVTGLQANIDAARKLKVSE